MTRIAFCGLGIMGNGMARNLIRHGHTLAVYNRTRGRAEPFAGLGARVAATPADAAREAEVMISMVADDRASRGVWLGNDGALSAARPGTLCIETSTLTPGWIRELARQAAARECELLDAPVTGSKAQAEGGELNYLVGGSAAALERARPLLLDMGKTIHHLGPTGSGAMMKLINNLIGGVQQVALAEGMALAESSGLDLEQVAQLLGEGPVGSPLVKRKLPGLLAHDFAPAFALALMHKDMTYALVEAANASVAMPTSAAAREVMQLAIARGWGGEDAMVVHRLFCNTNLEGD